MKLHFKIALLLLIAMQWLMPARAEEHAVNDSRPEVHKVLFIGDSMTGWLSERLNAYGKQNGFEVATVVWDGSTIRKWGNSPRLTSIIEKQAPDAIFVSLGMNELFETNPSRLAPQLAAIKGAAGKVPIIWVGPPSWPGRGNGKG
ncbi:MAG: hypothetical protein K2M87_06625, partial [Muribaculaceae bacterium]|nr:hypothetical protein [Muribaculaceae bacterium]